jgi:outer membrane protein, heavy metal efflux system
MMATNQKTAIKKLMIKEGLKKSFDKLRTNGMGLIPFVVSRSNALLSKVEGRERNQLVQRLLKFVVIVFALLPFATYAEKPPTISKSTLTLEEVLKAAQQAFPSLLSAEQRKQVAAGELKASEGGFDTLLKSQNRWSISGLYENENNEVSIEQPTALWGTTFFGGWRRGVGDYPVYEGKSETTDSGEARVGVNVPLWRNREIDRRRANLKQAELGQLIAGHEYDQALIEVSRLAAYRYWDWVLAGQRLQVAEHLLKIAEQRDTGIRERVAAGDIPEFEALDNQRAIIERRERVVAAQRLLEQNAIQLSLYWRDAEGQPKLPESEQLPVNFPETNALQTLSYDEATQTAKDQRPELQRLELQGKQTQTELELQQNQRAPGVDFSVSAAKDIGSGNDKLNRNELYLGLNIDIPLQQRVATGRSQVAAANLQRLKLDRQLQDDRIAAEVKDVFSALSAVKKRLELSAQQLQAAEQLEEGERTRFELGESTLLFVNLREIASGDAALLYAEATASLFRSYADYQATLGTWAMQNE